MHLELSFNAIILPRGLGIVLHQGTFHQIVLCLNMLALNCLAPDSQVWSSLDQDELSSHSHHVVDCFLLYDTCKASPHLWPLSQHVRTLYIYESPTLFWYWGRCWTTVGMGFISVGAFGYKP